MLGIGVAWLGVDVLRSAMPADVPRVAAIAVDLRILTVTGLVAVATGLIFGTAPVLQFSRVTSSGVLSQRERTTMADAGTQRLRSILVVSQVALAVVLLVGSGLFLASFARVTSIDLGVDHRDVLTVRVRPLVAPKEHGYGSAVMSVEEARQRNRQRLENVLERVRAIPGVETASLWDPFQPTEAFSSDRALRTGSETNSQTPSLQQVFEQSLRSRLPA